MAASAPAVAGRPLVGWWRATAAGYFKGSRDSTKQVVREDGSKGRTNGGQWIESVDGSLLRTLASKED